MPAAWGGVIYFSPAADSRGSAGNRGASEPQAAEVHFLPNLSPSLDQNTAERPCHSAASPQRACGEDGPDLNVALGFYLGTQTIF